MTSWHDQADAYRLRCGWRLLGARERAGLSRLQLAKRIGITDAQVIEDYETLGALPKIERMFRIAEVLGVDVGDIWGFDT